jgi:voltage-gated potassium channel
VGQLVAVTRAPLNALSIVWLGLVLADFAGLLGPRLRLTSDIIWGVFGLAFVAELGIAPDRKRFLRDNWFTGLTLLVPALRVLRMLSGLRLVAQGVRSLTALRVVSGLNRGLRSLTRVLRRHRLGYVLAITAVVVVGAAALLFRFESTAVLGRPGDGGTAIDTFGDALWWAAGAASFAGSDYTVRTNVGRALRLFMSFYSWSGFGYLTATVASHFLDPAADDDAPDPVAALTEEVQALRREVRHLTDRVGASLPPDADRDS